MLLGPVLLISLNPCLTTLSWVAYAVSKKGRAPTRNHSPQPLHVPDLRERLHVTLVQIGIHLSTTFDHIQRRHCGMGQALQMSVRLVNTVMYSGVRLEGLILLTQAKSPPNVHAA